MAVGSFVPVAGPVPVPPVPLSPVPASPVPESPVPESPSSFESEEPWQKYPR